MRRPAHSVIAYYGFLALAAAACIAWLATAEETPGDFTERLAGRLAEGKPVPVRWHAAIGLWWGAVINLGLAAGLAALGPWLLRPLPDTTEPVPTPRAHPRLRRLVIASVLGAVVSSAVLNAPRLRLSLWGDEEYSLRKAFVGEFSRDEEDRIVFENRPWRDTLFNYRSPNNHVFYSILARASNTLLHGADPRPDDPRRLHFSEVALRLPAFLAGLAALGTLAGFLVVAGFPRAALVAPWILALHPWFVRFAVEARGYALVFALSPLALALLLAALRRGGWWWWIGFAITQFLLFYTYPGTVYFIGLANLFAVASIAFDPRGRTVRRTLAARWFAAGSFSTMAVVAAMAPLYAQLKFYLTRDIARGTMGADWLRDVTAYLTTGMAWEPWDASNPLCLSWRPFAEAHPLWFGAGAALLAIACVAGCTELVRRSLRSRLLAVVVVLPPVLTYVHNAAAGTYMFQWYLVPALPMIAAVWAVGIAALPRWLADRHWPQRRADAAFLAAATVFLACFGAATAGQRRLFRTHPFEPLRESVQATREVLNPFHTDIDSVTTVGFHMMARGYDPATRQITTLAELEALVRRARDTGTPLYVNFAQEGLARVVFPDIVAAVENPERFELVGTFHGLDVQCTRLVYRAL